MGWIRLDTGLLDDADFGRLPAAARGAYVTAYLLQKRRDGAPFADHAELCRLLRKEGIEEPDVLVEDMRAMLEAPDPDGPELGIRRYDDFQRDHTGAERAKRYRERKKGQSVTSRVTSRDGTHREINSGRAHARRSTGEAATVDEKPGRPQLVHRGGGPVSFKDAMAGAGLTLRPEAHD